MRYSDYFPVFFTKEGAELWDKLIREEIERVLKPLKGTKSNFKYRQKQGAKPIKKRKNDNQR